MTMRCFAGLLLLLVPATARGQDAETHPAELTRVWAHEDSTAPKPPTRWSVIHFMADGSYRATRREEADSGWVREGVEPVTGRWAVVSTRTRGSLLCTRVDGAEQSRCNPYHIDPKGPRLLWREVGFISAESVLLQRLGLAQF